MAIAVQPDATRTTVLMRWHGLRRMVAGFSAIAAASVAIVLGWPAAAAGALVAALTALDAHIALKTTRGSAGPTLMIDITAGGLVCIILGVPAPGIAVVTSYFVVLVAVLVPATRAWPLALYAVVIGTLVLMAPAMLDLPDPPIERSIAAGVVASVVFGIATIEIVRRFTTTLRERTDDEERRVVVSQAVSVASRALVAEDDARALGFALEAIRGAIGATVAFVEQNVEDSNMGSTAIVVESSAASSSVHPAFQLGAQTPWSEMHGARSHLEGGAPFFFRIEEASGTQRDRSGAGGARAEVNVPIAINGVWVGVVGAADTNPSRQWQRDDLELLRTLADLTAAFWQRVENTRVRDSLIGSLDGRLRYEEALAKASKFLLGERGLSVDSALESIGLAASVDEVYITRTVPLPNGAPSAEAIAGWVQPGLLPIHAVAETVPYSEIAAIREAIQTGSLAKTMDGRKAELVVGIEVAGGWFGSVGFVRRQATRSWSRRDEAFLRTIADILGAYYERSQSRLRLESLLASKDQLIASVSHELRTPLTAVVGLAEELRANDGTIGPEEADQLIGVIADESREMADLVEDLLIAARSEDGTVAVFPERTDLALLTASVVSHLTVPDDIELLVDDQASAAFADPVRIRQVIRNLLTNAMRYGGKHVRVTFGSDGEATFLDVVDDGPGIPDHDLESIFEPYGRSSSGRVSPGSVGLGLTLSKRLSELMGGSLTYIPSSGCTFRLTVPSAPSEEAEALSLTGFAVPS
jgi:signal transduction histidine kinase